MIIKILDKLKCQNEVGIRMVYCTMYSVHAVSIKCQKKKKDKKSLISQIDER